jgi:DNA-binding NtrC family response regulator
MTKKQHSQTFCEFINNYRNNRLPIGTRQAPLFEASNLSLTLGVRVRNVFTILIADRNPRVRGFLEREMSAAGYRIRLAESAGDLLQWAFDRDPVDLIILDPDLPDAADSQFMNTLRKCNPQVPVIIHTHPGLGLAEPDAAKSFIVVEKGGSSVERLKEVAGHVLKHPRPVSRKPLSTAPFEH